jgi:hypothetical protein
MAQQKRIQYSANSPFNNLENVKKKSRSMKIYLNPFSVTMYLTSSSTSGSDHFICYEKLKENSSLFKTTRATRVISNTCTHYSGNLNRIVT